MKIKDACINTHLLKSIDYFSTERACYLKHIEYLINVIKIIFKSP